MDKCVPLKSKSVLLLLSCSVSILMFSLINNEHKLFYSLPNCGPRENKTNLQVLQSLNIQLHGNIELMISIFHGIIKLMVKIGNMFMICLGKIQLKQRNVCIYIHTYLCIYTHICMFCLCRFQADFISAFVLLLHKNSLLSVNVLQL